MRQSCLRKVSNIPYSTARITLTLDVSEHVSVELPTLLERLGTSVATLPATAKSIVDFGDLAYMLLLDMLHKQVTLFKGLSTNVTIRTNPSTRTARWFWRSRFSFFVRGWHFLSLLLNYVHSIYMLWRWFWRW